jgi:TetR/AcrR family transcriptional regulator, transcriptional repressor for nem operon
MSLRAQRAAGTREQLLDAALRLAERGGLGAMSVNLIVAEAGVAKGTFFHHFGDRSAFLLALHRAFHDRLFEEIMRLVGGTVPGRERLLAVANAYLDGCLRHPGVRALLLEMRAEPVVAAEIAARNERVSRLISPDFAALGWAHPRDGAALWNGLVVEGALLEHAAGRRRPAIRNALAQFLPPGAA